MEDLFIAHISGMDTLARGLRNAAKLLEVILLTPGNPKSGVPGQVDQSGWGTALLLIFQNWWLDTVLTNIHSGSIYRRVDLQSSLRTDMQASTPHLESSSR